MAVSYNAALKTARMQLVADLVDSKTAVASSGSALSGELVIGTSALSGATGVLATLNLPTPGFTVSGPTATLQGVPISTTATGAGTAALAELRDDAGGVVVSGLTVGIGSTDIILNSVTITIGQTVTISAGTITHSP